MVQLNEMPADGGQGTAGPTGGGARRAWACLGLLGMVVMLAVALPGVFAQTNGVGAGASAATKDAPTPAGQARAFEQATERIRADCVQGRRTICGRILKVFPDGLVVDSGYTNLMRPPLSRSWLVPGAAQAARASSLVEAREPGSVCVGLVFVTALPRSRLPKPRPYDYVVLQAYPAGQYTYTSVAGLQRTVRRFAVSLPSAIRLNRDAAGIKPPVSSNSVLHCP